MPFYRLDEKNNIIDFSEKEYPYSQYTNKKIIQAYDQNLYFEGEVPEKKPGYDRLLEGGSAYAQLDKLGIPKDISFNVAYIEIRYGGQYFISFINPLPNKYYKITLTDLPSNLSYKSITNKGYCAITFLENGVKPVLVEGVKFTATITTDGSN